VRSDRAGEATAQRGQDAGESDPKWSEVLHHAEGADVTANMIVRDGSWAEGVHWTARSLRLFLDVLVLQKVEERVLLRDSNRSCGRWTPVVVSSLSALPHDHPASKAR